MKRRARTLLISLLAAGLLSGVSLTGVSAGTAGQQASIHDVNGGVNSAWLSGDNQSCQWKTFGISNWPNPFYDVGGYWWQQYNVSPCNNGVPQVDSYSSPNYQGTHIGIFYFANGPPHSQSSDWWTCRIDGGYACKTGPDSI